MIYLIFSVITNAAIYWLFKYFEQIEAKIFETIVFNYIVAKKELEPGLETGLKWASLGAACTLVFAVQVQLLLHLLHPYRYVIK